MYRLTDRNARHHRLPTAARLCRLPEPPADLPQPRLEQWSLLAGDRLTGRIYDDPRFADGERITTSPVLLLSNHTATTRTTTYSLGRHA